MSSNLAFPLKTLTSTDSLVGFQSATVGGERTFTPGATGALIFAGATASDVRSTLGLGSLATQSGTFSGTSSGTNTGDQNLSGLLVKASNLSDLTSASTARTNLGLGSLATQSGTFSGTSSGTNTGDQDLSGLSPRAFRVLSNESPVLYTDGAIRFSAAGDYVSLPAPDETKIGAVFTFYGYDTGIVCGFYSNDGSIIIRPDGTVSNYFSVPPSATASAQLDDNGYWRVTLLETGRFVIPSLTGTVILDRENGEVQYASYLDGSVVLSVSNGVNSDQLEVCIGWTQNTPTLSFATDIRIPPAAAALMPITFDLWRSYSFTLQKRGGVWTLTSPIQGPTVEVED